MAKEREITIHGGFKRLSVGVWAGLWRMSRLWLCGHERLSIPGMGNSISTHGRPETTHRWKREKLSKLVRWRSSVHSTHLPRFDGLLLGRTVSLVIITTTLPCVETALMNKSTSTQIWEGVEHGLERAGDSVLLEDQWFSNYKSMEVVA